MHICRLASRPALGVHFNGTVVSAAPAEASRRVGTLHPRARAVLIMAGLARAEDRGGLRVLHASTST
jgi:hypothetical protein